MRVGPSQNPSGSPSTSTSRPSTTTVAPSAAADVDVRRDLVAVLPGDERAHVAAARAVAGAQRRHALGDLLDELVGDGVDREHDRDRHAALARRAEAGVDGGVGGEVEVGIRQHQHVVLRAAERLHALAVTGRRLVDVAWRSGSSRRTRSRATSGCSSSASTASLSPCTTLSTPSGRPASFSSAAIQFAAVGSFSRGLEDHGVAGGERDREEPQRHHRREVERADDADHAERLAERVDVDAGRDVLGVGALRQVPEAARELDDLHAAGDLAERVGDAPCRAPR